MGAAESIDVELGPVGVGWGRRAEPTPAHHSCKPGGKSLCMSTAASSINTPAQKCRGVKGSLFGAPG